jgi:predicted nucleic acid-binding protein
MQDPPTPGPDPLTILGPGEADAIALAAHLRVALLINEHRGAQHAVGLGVRVVTVSDVIVALRALDIVSDRAARRKLQIIAPNTARAVIDEALRALDVL